MDYKVVGIKKIHYVSKKTGREVNGTELHVEYVDKNVIGSAVDKIFCNDRTAVAHINLKDNIEIYYNKYGQVDLVAVK